MGSSVSNKTLAKLVSVGVGGSLVGTLLGGGLAGRNFLKEGYERTFPASRAHVENYQPGHMTVDEMLKHRFGHLKGVDANADPKKRPDVYDKIGYEAPDFNLENIKYAPKNSSEGRLQRLIRAEKIIDTVEDIRNIPKTNTIAAILMEESYGCEPLQENSRRDGGFGCGQQQGLRAQELGMRTVSNSRSYRDFNHGQKIRRLLEACTYDIQCIEARDERANLLKAIDTIARILEIGYQRFGSWDMAIQYYRGHVNQQKGLDYLQRIRRWQGILQDGRSWGSAAEDFERRNDMPFKEYGRLAGIAAESWGLPAYRGGPEVKRIPVSISRTN